MKQVCFLIDGFNMYHSIEDIEYDTGICYKWLNLSKLCNSFMYLFGKDYSLYKIFYFTAIAYHYIDIAKVERHENYIKCLAHNGIEVIRGHFKEKTEYCPICKHNYKGHVEKETDIAISCKLLELLTSNDNCHCDAFVLVTGDTDLIPAVNTSLRINPNSDIRFAFPYKRKNKDLLKLSPKSFKIRQGHYQANQFGNTIKLNDGIIIKKPSKW